MRKLGLVHVLGALTLLTGVSAHGKAVAYKDYPLDLHDGDRLVLIGVKGDVHLETGNANVMRVKKVMSDKAPAANQAALDNAGFNVRRDGQQLIIEQKQDPGASGQYTPELQFEISAATAPAELVFHDGSILVRNWTQSLALQMISGTVTTSETEGRLRIQIQKGDVHVTDHHGRVEIDSSSAKVTMKSVEGDVDLQNFTGVSALSEVTGAIDLRSQAGATTIAKSTGAVDFVTVRGPLSLEEFEGPLRGTAEQGNVTATLSGDVEVHIEANQGNVNLKLPSDSGASVKLTTEDGAMFAPEPVKAGSGRAKSMSGRLKGEGPRGTIVVKNKSGTSRVRM